MISKNHSTKNLLSNLQTINLYKSDTAKLLGKLNSFSIQDLKNNLITKNFSSKINLNQEKKLPLHKIFKESKTNFTKNATITITKKCFSSKEDENSKINNNQYLANNVNNSNNNNNNNFYINEYFFPAVTSILNELNKELKRKDLDSFLMENKSFEKLYKLFMEVLKKSEDNLFPYLTLIFEISKSNQSNNNNIKNDFQNKINIILSDNYLNLKRKYLCLAILNQIFSKKKAKEKFEAQNDSDFESSFKSRIFGGGLYESIMSQTDPSNPMNFKGAVIITKNYTDAIEYYETLRRFDKEGKIKIKKFGSVHLGIKGLSLKKESNLVAGYLTTEQEDKKNESWSHSKLNAMQNELPNNSEYNILIFPQDYINLFINSESRTTFSDSESEHYEKIIDFFKKIDPEIVLVDDFDLFSPNNLLHLKKFISAFDIKNFYANNKLNLLGKNHIFISSSIKMKNYFLHVEKEKNFDQAEINITAHLKSTSTSTTNPAIVEKTIKNFVNKNIVDFLEEIYLKKSITNTTFNKNTEANSEAKISISDLNLKFFIAKNFLKEKNFASKFYIEFEKLKENRQDEKLNKIMRNLKNSNNFSAAATANATAADYKKESYAIIVKENDFFLLEKNLKIINAEFKTIDKDFSVYDNLHMSSKNEKKKGIIYIVDEDSLKYIDFKFDTFYLFDTPDELASYFKIFSLLKEKGKLYIVSPSNEYKSKNDFFEDLAKLSL